MCDNKVSFYVPRGHDVKEVVVKCGNTDPHGDTAVCPTCENDPHVMRGIRNRDENAAYDEWVHNGYQWVDIT
jgi:hypothetical protein